MIKDAIGNELQIGDTVHAAGPNGTWLIGIITKTQEGGISFIANPAAKGQNHNQQPVTPDVLVLQVACVLAGHPGMPHPEVLKVVAKNVVDHIADSSVKM